MTPKQFDDEFFNEIKIVQKIIERMARNSFMIKGWTITLVVIALLVDGSPVHNIVAFLPWLVFWILDAYFLRLERCYRKLYEWLIENRPENRELMYDMKAESRFGKNVEGIIGTMLSKTLAPFYLTILVLIIIISYAATHTT